MTNEKELRDRAVVQPTWIQVLTQAFLVFSHFNTEITRLFYLSRLQEATKESLCGEHFVGCRTLDGCELSAAQGPRGPDGWNEVAGGKGTLETG